MAWTGGIGAKTTGDRVIASEWNQLFANFAALAERASGSPRVQVALAPVSDTDGTVTLSACTDNIWLVLGQAEYTDVGSGDKWCVSGWALVTYGTGILFQSALEIYDEYEGSAVHDIITDAFSYSSGTVSLDRGDGSAGGRLVAIPLGTPSGTVS